MPIVEIQGLGNVDFPDTMSHEDIVKAIQTNIMPKVQATEPAITQAENPVTPSALTPSPPAQTQDAFSGSFGRGLYNIAADVNLLKGKLTGDTEEAQKRANELRQWGSGVYKDTEKSFTEAPGTKIAELMGGSLPYMVAPIVAGAAVPAAEVGTVLGLGVTAADLAAGLVSAAQFTGSNLARQTEDEKKTLAEASLLKAGAAAIPQAALDIIGFEFIPGVRRIFRDAGQEITKEAAEQIVKKNILAKAGSLALETGKTMGVEGATEAGQQLFERLQAGLNITDEQARKEYYDNFIGGAILGGVMAGPGLATEHLIDKHKASQTDKIMSSIEETLKAGTTGEPPPPPPTAPPTPAPEPAPTTPTITLSQLENHAKTRLEELEAKANGKPAIQTTDEQGNPITLPAQPAQVMTEQEVAELKFLQEHISNAEKLAQGYGVQIGETMTTEGKSHSNQAALDELNGKTMPISPIYQMPKTEEPVTTKTTEPATTEPTTTEPPPSEPPPPQEPPKPTEPAKVESYNSADNKSNTLPTISSQSEQIGEEANKVINKDKPVYAKVDLNDLPILLGRLFLGNPEGKLEQYNTDVHTNESKVLPKTKQANQITVQFRPDTIIGEETAPGQFKTNSILPRSIESITVHNVNSKFKFPQMFWDLLDNHFNVTRNPDDSLTYTLRREKTAEQKSKQEEDVIKKFEEFLKRKKGKLSYRYKVVSRPGLNKFQQLIEKYDTVGDAFKDILSQLEQALNTDDATNAQNPLLAKVKEGYLNKDEIAGYIEIIKQLMKIEPVMLSHVHVEPTIVRSRGHGVNGFYNPYENLIALFATSKLKTFIHETIHAAALHEMRMNPSGEFALKIKKLLRASKKAANGEYFYGHTDPDEFLAEAFSNYDFMQHLAKTKSVFSDLPKTSLFDDFRNIVRKLFNVSSEFRSLFDDVMDLSDTFFTGKTLESFKKDRYSYLLDKDKAIKEEAEHEEGSRQIFNYRGEPVDIRKWQIPSMSKIAEKLDHVFWAWADEHSTLDKVQKAIKALGRTISDMSDMARKMELRNSKITDRLEHFVMDEVNPIIRKMLDYKISLDDIKEYLHARHAEEYNNRMNELNHRVDADGNIIPYGLKDRASGMTTEDARNYLNSLDEARENQLKDVANMFYAIRDKTQQILVESGQETQETIDLWNEIFPDYVPLNREQEQQAVPAGMRTGAGVDVRGNFSKRAMGSEKAIINPIDALLYQRERAIARAENNEVSKSVYRLALENPNPDFWMAINPDAIHNREALIEELQAMGYANAEEIADNIMAEPKERYLRRVKPSDFVIDPTTGLVIPNTKEVVDARVSRNARFGDNVLSLKINGRERFVFFNQKDPNAIRMVRSLKNLEAEKLGPITKAMRSITHYFGQVNTVIDPVFSIVNGLKDYPFAMANLSTTALKGKQAEVTSKIFPAMMGIISTLRKQKAGDNTAESEWQNIYKEAKAAGFQTANRYAVLKTGEDKAYIEQTMNRFSGNDKKAFRYVIDALYDFGSMMENGVRLAAYKTARDNGMSPEAAASLAKNLTVNFDKKGARTGTIRSLFLFFNASVRSTVRLAETLNPKTNPTAPYIIGGGILLGVMQAMLLAAAGFKDDDPPEYIKEHNLVFPTSDGKYVTVPLAYGLNILPNIGRVFTEYGQDVNKHGWHKAQAMQRALNLSNSFFSSFSPFGNQGLTPLAIVPSAAEPLVGLTINKNAFGQTISRQDSYTRPTPGYTRTKETGSTAGKEIARLMNLAMGGTDYAKAKLWSPTGDDIDFLIGSVTGGPGREISKIGEFAKNQISGEQTPAYRVPVLGRFYGETDTKPVISSRFYNNINQMYEHENTIKNLVKDPVAKRQYLQDNPDARMWPMAEKFEAQINDLNAMKKKLQMANRPKEQIDRLDNKRIILMNRFNDQLQKIRNQ
jgi:hypothetical protein